MHWEWRSPLLYCRLSWVVQENNKSVRASVCVASNWMKLNSLNKHTHEGSTDRSEFNRKPHLSSFKLAKLPFQIHLHGKGISYMFVYCGTIQTKPMDMLHTSNSWFISAFFFFFCFVFVFFCCKNNHNVISVHKTEWKIYIYLFVYVVRAKQAKCQFPIIRLCMFHFISNETNDNHCNYNNNNDNIDSIGNKTYKFS